jgi:hypothetical protein
MADQQYAKACPKFAESARLDLSSGVELALAICYEGEGKLASAWGAYTSAVSLARRDGRRDRVAAASQGATALEPKLAHVTFAVDPETMALRGLEVREDDAIVRSAEWNDGPVDPGPHTLEVKAPGHVPFTTLFTIETGAPTQIVAVPPLEERIEPESLPPEPLPLQPAHPSNSLRTAGFIGAGTGVALLATGLIFGEMAISDASDVRKACPATPCSNAAAVSKNETAGAFADASTGTLIAGGALVAAGALLILLVPTPKAAPTSAARVHVDWGPFYLRAAF